MGMGIMVTREKSEVHTASVLYTGFVNLTLGGVSRGCSAGTWERCQHLAPTSIRWWCTVPAQFGGNGRNVEGRRGIGEEMASCLLSMLAGRRAGGGTSRSCQLGYNRVYKAPAELGQD